ncbi:MAG TPA: hypothetical protein VJT70_08055 [Sphingomicrobium sp.]|nr:hypothetical protein [Sphingomicrobium sp.]
MAYALKFAALSLILAVPATGAAAVSPKAKAQEQPKYCFQYEQDTGSRISRMECKTKAEWARLGVDVDDSAKK